MDPQAYLARIGFDGPVEHDRDTLERLQRAHLTAVPFENLHVFHQRGVRTDTGWSVSKVVDAGRGGWCYELNGAFHALLAALGFDADLLGATVLLDAGSEARPQPDHATIEVRLDRPFLVDVGFGDSFIRPIPLDTTEPTDGGNGDYRVVDSTLVWSTGEGWNDLYRIARRHHQHEEFEPSNRALQSDGTTWREKPFATRLLDGGPDRVTLLSDRIKFRRDGEWTEEPVAPPEWAATLDRWFGMAP